MTQDDKPDSMDRKVDALAAMADGEDISQQGFNAVQDDPPAGESDAEAAFVAQSAPPADESDAVAAFAAQSAPATPPATVPVVGSAAVSGARRARASTLQRQRSRVHAEQFKRMMVPILMVTGIILLILGGIVTFMMKQGDPDLYTGTGLLNDPGFKRIMVITSFPLGAILLIGAWLFRADLKRAEAAAQRENARD